MTSSILKRCPILQTLLHQIIVSCWSTRTIPACWKRGATILIYNRGDPSDPSNFRPITLQPVWFKTFSNIYSSKISIFLKDNKYIDKHVQKGFMAGVNGVSQHCELLAHLIKTARREQRSICISLLDIKNAFGLVHQIGRASCRERV